MPHEEYGYDLPSSERPGIFTRLVKLNRTLLFLLIIPAGIIYFWPPLKEQEAARQQLDTLVMQRDGLKADAALLQQKLDLIKNDPEYLEVMARDRLHLQKDGEIILRFEDKAAK
jgi:cell division protein FtsB